MKRLVASILILTIALCSAVIGHAQEEKKPDVPQIKITTTNGVGNTIQKADGYVPAAVSIEGEDGSVLEDSVSFKVRGNSTALEGIDKKAFTFKFAKKKNVLNMGKGKKWALLANTFDPTLMRNYIAFDLAQKLEIPYTSNQKMVELWVDGVFKGCYQLMEPVQAGSDRVDIDVEGDDGKKDFMIELEASRAESDVTYISVNGIRFAVSEPEEPTEEQVSYIRTTLSDVFGALNSKDRERIENILDVSSFVKFYVLNEYIKTWDFDFSSVFFYFKDGKLYAGPPWDYDLSMGNVNKDFSAKGKKAIDPEGIYTDQMHIYKMLTRLDWFNEAVKKEFIDNFGLLTDTYSEGGVIDRFLESYKSVIDRNFNEAGWKVGRYYVNVQRKPLATYEENLSYLRDWLKTRTEWLESYLGIERPTESEQASTSESVSEATETTEATKTTETTETAESTETTVPTSTAEPVTETTEATEATTKATSTTEASETSAPTETTKPPYELGDVNLDKIVNVKDATELQKHLADLVKLNEVQLSLCDTTRDGLINIKDATMIQKIAAKLV